MYIYIYIWLLWIYIYIYKHIYIYRNICVYIWICRDNLANLESNENQVFYWVHDVGYEGVLLRGLDGYGSVGTGFGAGTGAGTVQVR